MVSPDVAEANTQWHLLWKRFAGDRQNADLIDRRGLAVSWADCPFPFWNMLFFSDLEIDRNQLEIYLGEAVRYMHSKRYAGMLHICLETLTEEARQALPALLLEVGLQSTSMIRGMLGKLPLETAPTHSSLRFERVTGAVGLDHLADINCHAYGLPIEWGRPGLEGSKVWTEEAFTYIGFINDEAISTAAAIVSNDFLYLVFVATLPSAHRQGIATATIRHCLAEAWQATGITRTILHASESGMPVYERLGYHATAHFQTCGLKL